MKSKLLLAALVIGSTGWASAATLGGAGMRDSLTEAESLGPVSAGVDYQMLKRKVSLDGGGTAQLQTKVYSAQLGVDLTPWCMVFGTFGRSEAGWDGGDYGTGKAKWSAGTRLNWWHTDITDPEFMEGRLSFQTVAEFAQYRSGDDWRWNEGYADLTLNYELFVEKMKDIKSYPYSLVLYGGPAVSKLSGHAGSADFSEDKLLGAVGGVDLYLSHNLSLGGQLTYFDQASFGISARYHF
ncbi:MAG: hypothetical protein EPN23_01020 [Verrucomicrobia bacterium]|nr:MAG: hypothetical protein EPN23_01020 [Verrucomicrobiota bacterium]